MYPSNSSEDMYTLQDQYASRSHSFDDPEIVNDRAFWDAQMLTGMLPNETWGPMYGEELSPKQMPRYHSPAESSLSDQSLSFSSDSSAPCGTCASCTRTANLTRKGSKRVQKCPQAQARRRQQNRDAQRSYRERQDRQKKVLEDQVEAAMQKHQELLQKCDLQSDEITSLRSRVEALQFELETISAWRDTSVKFECVVGDDGDNASCHVRLVDEDVLIAEDGSGLGQWQAW